jgi:hydroxymethylpyrimidine/phosphomethylpyrimidine kinase
VLNMQKVVLSIAGLDPSGGAGILADVRAISAFGCFPAGCVTSITFQNTTGVFGAENVPAEILRRQILPILQDYEVAAVKTGMLPTAETICVTAELLKDAGIPALVVDPVVRSTSGFDLIDDAALRALIANLFPIATLVTPNIQEAERITGIAIESRDDIALAAEIFRGLGAQNVLIKGGHLRLENSGEPKRHYREAVDFLYVGDELFEFRGEYHETNATHGTGCVLSSAIAANLAIGLSLTGAVETAKRFVNDGIRNAPMLGKGFSPIAIRPISQSEQKREIDT